MSRTIKIAAVQMVAQTAPTEERLARAEALVSGAAADGADLVVLPEIFNTGYIYHDNNYQRAEPMDGPTVGWMKQMASEHQIHLAGSLLLLDEHDIYNTLLLIAPDGRIWRYDKTYPWYFERAYFRNGPGITIADTELGKLGLLICWDVAHTNLWQKYAGQVDAMVVTSCPPTFHDMTLRLPDGISVTSEEMGGRWPHIKKAADATFGALVQRQVKHLSVPLVNTTGTGKLQTHVPGAYVAFPVYVAFRPDLWRYWPQANQVILEANYFNETYVTDASGAVIAVVEPEAEDYVVAEVELSETQPQPIGSPPHFGLPPEAYWLDILTNIVMSFIYRRQGRQQHGKHMAPLSLRTRLAFVLIIIVLLWNRLSGKDEA